VARAKKPATAGDMVRSLAVILVPVLLITALFTRNLDDHPVQEVDYRAVLAQAREEAPFPVLAPTNLPSTWRATRVQWIPQGEPYLEQPSVRNRWQLGFLSPESIFVSVQQGDVAPEDFVDDVSRDGVPDGRSQVGGQPWERRISPEGRTRSLVRTTPQVTTVVVGDTTYEGLEAFASTLSAE
jgi:Protein of unknown function (DUF4245)